MLRRLGAQKLDRQRFGRWLGQMCLFALCITLAGCATYGGHRVEDGEGMRQKSWEDFLENRPEPEYVYAKSPAVTELCADITDVYIMTIETVDSAAERAENCEVACKLEAVRRDFGEDAYVEALGALSRAERRAYRRYERNEINELRIVEHLWYKANAFSWHMSDLVYELSYISYEYGWIEGLCAGFEAAGTIALMDEQLEYTVEALSWLREYQKLLERAENYEGR